jgi:hypothetical protein
MLAPTSALRYGQPMDDTLIAERLCALGNETRLKIYRILVRAGRDGAWSSRCRSGSRQ